MHKRFARKITKAFGAAVLTGLALSGCNNSNDNNNSFTPLVPDCTAASSFAPLIPGPHDGPITPIIMECHVTRYQDDLGASIPGTGIAIGGDSVPGPPQLYIPGVYNGDNPLQVPEPFRPLPTGTAIGPNGEHYAFYAVIPLVPGAGFKFPHTVIVDLAHPEKPLFTLHRLAQASGAYDPQSGRMIILGNTEQDETRALWQSAPISQNPKWWETLDLLGEFSGPMNGDRESQIVALPKGGFLIVGAGDARAIMAVTANTPQELLTAKPRPIISSRSLPQVYGPTITDIQDIDGKEVVTLRVSTYGIPGPPGIDKYDPHTYTTTFPIIRGDSLPKRPMPPIIAPKVK
jgi:hypothetical protein